MDTHPVRQQLNALETLFATNPASASCHVAAAIEYLGNARKQAHSQWPQLVKDDIQTHPLWKVVRECPLTDRSASRPRGYAGDAVMIDYLYGVTQPDLESLGPVAKAVFGYSVSSPAGRAVRYRRYRLANLIDSLAVAKLHAGDKGLRILSVAAGHGRELALSVAYQQGLVTEMVALDQDQNSLDQLVADYGQGPAKVTPLPLSVRSLLAGKHDLGTFDLIYSAGLYDYLDTAIAQRLTSRLFDALSPRGRLLYANFAPDIHSVGYMEAAMDWWLIYRDAQQTLALSDEIDKGLIAQVSEYSDPDKNIHFVELERAGGE